MSDDAPATARVGGRSGRLTSALVVLTLVGTVGVAAMNRPPASPPAKQVAAPPHTSTPQPDRSGEPVAPPSSPSSARSLWGIALGDDAFAAITMIADRQYLILLDDGGAGTLKGSARLPYPRSDAEASIELAQLWDREPGRNFQTVGRWSLPLDLLMPELRHSGTVLTVNQLALPQVGNNRLARGGFRLDVRLESRKDFGMILVTVTTQTDRIPAEPHRVYGEDGIFGLPGWPWRADDSPAAPPVEPSRDVFNGRGIGPGNIAIR